MLKNNTYSLKYFNDYYLSKSTFINHTMYVLYTFSSVEKIGLPS